MAGTLGGVALTAFFSSRQAGVAEKAWHDVHEREPQETPDLPIASTFAALEAMYWAAVDLLEAVRTGIGIEAARSRDVEARRQYDAAETHLRIRLGDEHVVYARVLALLDVNEGLHHAARDGDDQAFYGLEVLRELAVGELVAAADSEKRKH